MNNAFSSKVSTMYKDGILAESKEDGEKILLKETRGGREEARFIFDYVNKLCEKGEDLKRVCVLTRDNNYNMELVKSFIKSVDMREQILSLYL